MILTWAQKRHLGRVTCWPDQTRRVHEHRKINIEIHHYCTHTAQAGQRASALPRAKIEISSISDAELTASPAKSCHLLIGYTHGGD